MKTDTLILWMTVHLLSLVRNSGSQGYCSFPQYLWTSADGSRKHWVANTEHIGASDRWNSQDDVTVKEQEIIIHKKTLESCSRHRRHSHIPCHNYDEVIHIYCLMEQRNEKYRVHIQDRGGGITFSCIRFVEINDNVIQLYQAIPDEKNEDKLCRDEFLLRRPWLWIYPSLHTWHFCPSLGGFDFRAMDNSGKNKCANEWLPSRFESECIVGDSLTFFFPQASCSPFENGKKEFHLQCWGSWAEDNVMFVLLGRHGKPPRYVLRLPNDIKYYDEIQVQLFLNAFAPLNTPSTESSKQTHYSLSALRGAPGVCYDESEHCRLAESRGKCSTSPYDRHTSMCKQSCGFCELAPNEKSECVFPADLQGVWLLFTEHSQQEIAIMGGDIMMSSFGDYTCKSRWENNYFKVMSSYSNGCRPRYSCLRIERGAKNTLFFQISKSGQEDTSFDLCHFSDDFYPLNDYIHSITSKILLPIESMYITQCHWEGSADVVVTFHDATSCDFRMSDVDEYTCESKSALTLRTSHDCPYKTNSIIDYKCIASVELETGSKMLVTEAQHRGEVKHVCWKILLKQRVGVKGSYMRISCDSTLVLNNATVDMAPADIMKITPKDGLPTGCGHIQDDSSYDVISSSHKDITDYVKYAHITTQRTIDVISSSSKNSFTPSDQRHKIRPDGIIPKSVRTNSGSVKSYRTFLYVCSIYFVFVLKMLIDAND